MDEPIDTSFFGAVKGDVNWGARFEWSQDSMAIWFGLDLWTVWEAAGLLPIGPNNSSSFCREGGRYSNQKKVMTPPVHTFGPSHGEPRPIPEGPLKTTSFEGPKTIETLRRLLFVGRR